MRGRSLTVHSQGSGRGGVAGPVDGLAHVHAGVLGNHRHDVQRDEAKVVSLLDAGAYEGRTRMSPEDPRKMVCFYVFV